MFKELSITACEDITVRDLIGLHKSGHGVYRTSHAGNWNIYKLLLSELGLPDCIWDVTCMYRDVNNQPQQQLLDGKKLPLLEGVPKHAERHTKHLTAYRRTRDHATTLAHFHVSPLKQLFGNVVTTHSEALLEYAEYLRIAFDVAQTYCPETFGRYVLPCGCMVKLEHHSGVCRAKCSHHYAEIPAKDLAASAIGTLEELRRLMLDPEGYEPKGGVVYSFELAAASYYLWSYWKFGDKTVYELSGPDMIGYATKSDFIEKVGNILRILGAHMPKQLVPTRVEARIVPATHFRFGYPDNCQRAKSVMSAHEVIRQLQPIKRSFKDIPEIVESLNHSLRGSMDVISRHESHWNLFHDPAVDAFYSQHDMLATGARMVIPELFLDMPFHTMGTILSALPQTEQALKKQFLRASG